MHGTLCRILQATERAPAAIRSSETSADSAGAAQLIR
jgi:hypothetical protein